MSEHVSTPSEAGAVLTTHVTSAGTPVCQYVNEEHLTEDADAISTMMRVVRQYVDERPPVPNPRTCPTTPLTRSP
jgi:hypothetical protein